MRYIKLLWFDIRNGMIYNPVLFVIPVIIALIACFDLANRITALNEFGYFAAPVKGSVADYMMYIYGGMDRYVPEPNNSFVFPVRWAVVFLMPSFLTLNYPYKDMQGIGQQILVRTKGRTTWWLCKCVWNILSVLVYHLILLGIAILFGFVCGSDVFGEINKELQYVVFQMARNSILPDDASWPFVIIFLPVLVSLCINILQMTLSLFIKPIFSFFAAAFLMISSAYFVSPYLIGNYAMSIRYNMVMKDGVSITGALVVSLALSTIAVGAGAVRFHQYDILNRD